MLNHLDRFYRIATQYQLSAAAILLWQMLYVYMSRCGSFESFAMATSVFVDRLQISRQGLLQARKCLEEAGLLSTELDANQQLRYTLCLDGRVVEPLRTRAQEAPLSEAAIAAIAEPLAQQPAQGTTGVNVCAAIAPQHVETMQAVAEGNLNGAEREEIFADATTHRGDIILNGGYKRYLDVIERRMGKDVRFALYSWLKLRQANGWTLTLWGFEELLQNLIRLAAGEVSRMVDIVKQSVRRRWKGFFALKVQSKPSGEKLLREERREQQTGRQDRSRIKPYVTDDMDLSIFEE